MNNDYSTSVEGVASGTQVSIFKGEKLRQEKLERGEREEEEETVGFTLSAWRKVSSSSLSLQRSTHWEKVEL